MDRESMLKIRDACILAISKLKDVKEIDRLEAELIELNLFNPVHYEDNRKVLQKNYYENQKWKK